jgi:hypothetical protein
VAGGASGGVCGAESDEEAPDDDEDKSTKGEERMPGEELMGCCAGEVVKAKAGERRPGLGGDGHVVRGAAMERQEAADQHAGQEG